MALHGTGLWGGTTGLWVLQLVFTYSVNVCHLSSPPLEAGQYLLCGQVVTVRPGFDAPCWAVAPPAGELQWIHRVGARSRLQTHHKHSISVYRKVKVSKHALPEFLGSRCTALVPVLSLILCPSRSKTFKICLFWHQIPAQVDINTEILKSHTLLADCIWKSASLFPVVSLSLNFSTALLTAFSTDASSQKTFTGSWRSRETQNDLTEDHSHQNEGKHTPWLNCFPFSTF